MALALDHFTNCDEFDYRTEDIANRLTEYDAGLDTVGSGALATSYDVLRRGRQAGHRRGSAGRGSRRSTGITTTRQVRQSATPLSELRVLIEDGVVTPRVGKTFRLGADASAFEARSREPTRGKVVLLPGAGRLR